MSSSDDVIVFLRLNVPSLLLENAVLSASSRLVVLVARAARPGDCCKIGKRLCWARATVGAAPNFFEACHLRSSTFHSKLTLKNVVRSRYTFSCARYTKQLFR